MRLRDIHTVSVQKLESTRVVVCAYYSVCSALGADMFDCVYPSRTARFGTALIPEGVLRLKTAAMASDYRPIDSECDCMVCMRYSRAHLHAKITKEPNAASLLTYHNIRYQMRLCEQMHQVTYPTSKHVDDASTASVGFSSVAFQNEFPGLTMSDGNR
mmetsp:Transcript_6443/g.24955  ORF Transcript_6443/g.24955 Transcript_6443/m.24955 type:complete len:158 (-) Transcript_6443:1068-1541(-)